MGLIRGFSRLAKLGALGGVVTFVYASDPRASFYEYAALPFMRRAFDAEEAPHIAVDLMRYPFLNPKIRKAWLPNLDPDHALYTVLFSNSANPRVKPITIQTPIGVAAGIDKNGQCIDSLFNYGFSWVEIGSVTPLPQPGNPKPRVFRLPKDQAIINRYGFNSDGHAAVLARLRIREEQGPRSPDKRVLAVNLGKNKTGEEVNDYVRGVRSFGDHADVLVVNISSPNTPGLRDLQAEGKLLNLLTTLVGERDKLKASSLPPMVVKIAPDLDDVQVKAIAEAVVKSKIDGVIVGNTTVSRDPSLKSGPALTSQTGGLSGRPVKEKELKVLKTLRESVGPDLTIIGCGGIFTGQDAIEYKKAGANMVQTCTGFVYKGPGIAAHLAEEIKQDLGGAKWSDL